MSRWNRATFGLWALVIIVAATLSSWWLMGDFTETDPATADYLYRPPRITGAQERAIGILSIVALAVAIGLFVWMWRREHPRSEWAFLIGVWSIAGIGAAFVERGVTAGVVGANIGGGLLLFLSPIAVVGLLVTSAWLLVRLRQRDELTMPVKRSSEGSDSVQEPS